MYYFPDKQEKYNKHIIFKKNILFDFIISRKDIVRYMKQKMSQYTQMKHTEKRTYEKKDMFIIISFLENNAYDIHFGKNIFIDFYDDLIKKHMLTYYHMNDTTSYCYTYDEIEKNNISTQSKNNKFKTINNIYIKTFNNKSYPTHINYYEMEQLYPNAYYLEMSDKNKHKEKIKNKIKQIFIRVIHKFIKYLRRLLNEYKHSNKNRLENDLDKMLESTQQKLINMMNNFIDKDIDEHFKYEYVNNNLDNKIKSFAI